jgi:hypothetical protein
VPGGRSLRWPLPPYKLQGSGVAYWLPNISQGALGTVGIMVVGVPLVAPDLTANPWAIARSLLFLKILCCAVLPSGGAAGSIAQDKSGEPIDLGTILPRLIAQQSDERAAGPTNNTYRYRKHCPTAADRVCENSTGGDSGRATSRARDFWHFGKDFR